MGLFVIIATRYIRYINPTKELIIFAILYMISPAVKVNYTN